MLAQHHLSDSRWQRVLWLLEELGAPYRLKTYQRVALGLSALLFSLAVSCPSAHAERFSIRCFYTQPFYVTFDTESGRVVEETLSGSLLKGVIDRIEDGRIDFHVTRPGTLAFELIWDARTSKLSGLPVPGNSGRRGNVFDCGPTELRPVLSHYDDLQ
jgi:hypothetical protein